MKLLFDANLSPKLVGRLAELFPGSVHVFDTGLAQFTPDETIWEYARTNGFTIVTADSDFLALANSRGAPPHVVHLEKCDYRTTRVEDLLRRHAISISELELSSRAILLISGRLIRLPEGSGPGGDLDFADDFFSNLGGVAPEVGWFDARPTSSNPRPS